MTDVSILLVDRNLCVQAQCAYTPPELQLAQFVLDEQDEFKEVSTKSKLSRRRASESIYNRLMIYVGIFISIMYIIDIYN